MSNKPLRIFIGFDSAEPIAYHVCCQSILEKASRPVSFTPVGLINVPDEYTRPRGERDSTEFAISRFLVPWMCDFQGQALFMDCDMLFRGDVAELFDSVSTDKSVFVVKHDYIPKSDRKFLGQKQTRYIKKNWSSVMLFNNAQCKALSLDYVQNAQGLELHQFKWLNDSEIGELEPTWNHLVGEYPESNIAKNLHFTLGGPYFSDYQDTDHAADWFDVLGRALVPMSSIK